jgi:hypothetical protein
MHLIRSTHIFIISYLLLGSVFVTPSSGRPLSYLLKNYTIFTSLQKAYLTYVRLVGLKKKWLEDSKVSVFIPLSYFPNINIHCWWRTYSEKSWFYSLHKWLNWGTFGGNRSCVIEMVTAIYNFWRVVGGLSRGDVRVFNFIHKQSNKNHHV